MTPPIDDPETLRHILANTDALLLDFDGPICSVFSGFPAPIVAQQLRDVLAQGGHTNLPEPVASATDPFNILFYAAKLGPDEARYVEATFTAHEVEAVQAAEPTPGAHDLIHTWNAANHHLAVVSNNSTAAVETYLSIHRLRGCVDTIAARTNADISLLKPSSYLIVRAIDALDTRPDRCAFIGDSISDVQAARAADVAVIAYANSPSKIRRLSGMKPNATVSVISAVLSAYP